MGADEVSFPKFLKSLGMTLHEAVQKAVDDELDDELIYLIAKEVPQMMVCYRLDVLESRMGEIEIAIDNIAQGMAGSM